MKINLKSLVLGVVAVLAVTMTLTSQQTFAATNSCRYNVYRYGSTGYCVRELQTLLHGPFGTNYYHNPYTVNLTVDGGFGPNTRSAVIKFQRYYGGLAVDAIVGPQTWRGLCEPVAPNTITPSASWRAAYNATCP